MPDAWPLRLSPILLVVFCADAGASGARKDLAAGFDRPPEDTRPACYWYRMSDHISEADLTKDFEPWHASASARRSSVTSNRAARGSVKLLTEAWLDTMRQGCRTGASIGMFNAPGEDDDCRHVAARVAWSPRRADVGEARACV